MKVIIIGAGAPGIMAANVLSKKGVSVTILESQNRIGGRIHTFVPDGFINTIEAGAEFIHGSLPLTLKLLKRAKLSTVNASMNMYRFKDGKTTKDFGNSKAWEHFYTLLAELDYDITIDDFFSKHFHGKKYELLHHEVRQMAQGLDLADPAEVNLLSLKEEWLSEDMQFRPVTGYQPLLEFLLNEALVKDCKVLFDQKVKEIVWKSNNVTITTQDKSFSADAVIVTTSLGCLLQNEIKFRPNISETTNLFHKIGFGNVIKIALEFNQPFWENSIPDLGFLFSEKGLTFWTQLDQHVPVLTGWIGSDYVSEYDVLSDDKIIDSCLKELNSIFPETKIQFRVGVVFRYNENSVSRGAYSWPKPESKKAVKQINKGIENTIFFAGEAFDPTFETATVEAALESGKYVAGKIFKNRRAAL